MKDFVLRDSDLLIIRAALIKLDVDLINQQQDLINEGLFDAAEEKSILGNRCNELIQMFRGCKA